MKEANPYKVCNETPKGDEMTIQQHKHCLVCEKAIPTDKRFCSERCETIHEERRKRARRRMQWIFYGGFAIIFGWFIIMAFAGRG